MLSPFPGMDPYLEAQPFWNDLQSTLIATVKGELKKRLPSGYSVWAGVYIWLHEPDAETRKGRPDVFLSAKQKELSAGGVATLSSPATSILPAVRREGNKYLKIRDVQSDRVITVIEILSPTKKTPGDDREAYLVKRNEYLATGTNLVEIDLLRAGPRMPLGDPTPPPANYYVLVCRASDFPKTGIWPISVRDALPDITIPLKPEDGFVLLPLQQVFAAAYEQGPYEYEVDYSKGPAVPLEEADAVWAKALLAKKRPK
jgi:Protein of unknown function (DUF4058)